MSLPFHTLSPQEFEDLQLKADNVFCRRCGLVDDLAIAMSHIEVVSLDENVLPGAVGSFHVYQCPVCGHRALSEQS